MTQELIECKHCKGTGTCLIKGMSCGGCKKARLLPINSRVIVPCDSCKGLGKNSPWYIQQRETLSRPIEEMLTGYDIKQGQDTIRILDRRKFIISIIAFLVGLILVGMGIFFNVLNALLPVASGLMTGAIGYFVGGQLNQARKDYEAVKDALKQKNNLSIAKS